ncbi:MAG: hypothetical protein Q9198_003363 [Flavoplaca austrocitrina]
MEGIQEELEDLQSINCDQKPFIIHDSLKSLLDKKRVEKILSELVAREKIQVYQQREIFKSILENGIRLFATLLSISRPERILDFIETDHFIHDQLDSRLPLSQEAVGHILKDPKLCARFYQHQWRFFPPVFSADRSHRGLQCETRLPFVSCEELGEGGFGKVAKVGLPPLCQTFLQQSDGEVYIVRKQIKKTRHTEPDFQREQHILSLLRCLRHPNIVQLLTSYTIHETHNFLFPVADGDLKTYFQKDQRPAELESENDVFHALFELASAIEAVHDYFSESFNLRKIGCHYDLKPDNILYCSRKFILSDFGLSRLGGEKDGSKSLYRDGGGEYMAPECVSVDEDFQKLRVGRSSDMWSFGCILSEMLTHLLMGPSGIKAFSEARVIVFAAYFTCKAYHGGDKPHEGVIQWLQRLSNSVSSKSQEGLMGVIQDLLQIEPNQRPKAKQVTLSLFQVTQLGLIISINEKFRSLLLGFADLELQIEFGRFQLWGNYTGLNCEPKHFQKHKTMGFSQKFSDMQMLRQAILNLLTELERLSRVLRSTEPRAFRLYYHIQKANDEIWDMLPAPMRFSMTQELENRLLSTDDKFQLDSLEAKFCPVTPESESPTLLDASCSKIYKRIGLLAAMKKIASELETRTKFGDRMQLDQNLIKIAQKSFHFHLIGTYQALDTPATQVLIERLEYDRSWSARIEELLQRIQDIASSRAIPSTGQAFPVLTCAGFYHHIAKRTFGLVYQFPSWPAKVFQPIPSGETPKSLKSILSQVRSRADRPSLDSVFAIASNLLNIVLTMHKANWLHKSISSYNIIFFSDRFESIAESMKSPYFIGFNYSRLNLGRAFSEGPNVQLEYQHPDYKGGQKRFCQEYEYYSVGLVLLELGLWMPLADITRNIIGDLKVLRQVLLDTKVPSLGSYMGTAYAEAVAVCLRGDFGNSTEPADVREEFERKVLRKIDKLSMAYTDLWADHNKTMLRSEFPRPLISR